MVPKPHQQRFIDQNPDKAILNWECRVGKTLPAAIWVDLPGRVGNAYVITKKSNYKDWLRMNTKANVMTKEQFKKVAKDIVNPTAIVVDEAHNFASALFVRKGTGRSGFAEELYNLVRKYPDCPILLLTATPIRQDPWSLHTLLCYIGVYYDWKMWRNEFFTLEARPFLPRPKWMKPGEVPRAWMEKHDWKTAIRKYLEQHTDIVSLSDIVENLPPLEVKIIKVKNPKYEKPEDRLVTWTDEHLHEQKGKVKEILEMGFKKLIVVAHYTNQIDELERELSKDKPVYVLDGRTKDMDATKIAAQQAEECYFIVQAGMGEGFDGYMFGAMVFASMSHSCFHHTQMIGRPRHIEHLHPVLIYYLIGGKWDQRIYDTIESGKDFNAHVYLNESSGATETT